MKNFLNCIEAIILEEKDEVVKHFYDEIDFQNLDEWSQNHLLFIVFYHCNGSMIKYILQKNTFWSLNVLEENFLATYHYTFHDPYIIAKYILSQKVFFKQKTFTFVLKEAITKNDIKMLKIIFAYFEKEDYENFVVFKDWFLGHCFYITVRMTQFAFLKFVIEDLHWTDKYRGKEILSILYIGILQCIESRFEKFKIMRYLNEKLDLNYDKPIFNTYLRYITLREKRAANTIYFWILPKLYRNKEFVLKMADKSYTNLFCV